MQDVNGIEFKGTWNFTLLRDGKVIDEWDESNLVVDEGINHILNVAFNAAAQATTWYIGIYEGNYTPVAGVTAATIASASTESVAYAESVRQTYVEAASTAKSITNSASRALFTMNAAKTIYGAFLVSSSVKGGTAGVLAAAAKFSQARSLENGDQLLVGYTITGAAA